MQDTLNAVETVKAPGIVTRLRRSTAAKISAVTGALFSLSLLVAGPANASTYTDPTGGAGDGFIDDLKGYFLNEVVVKALGLMVVVLSISVLVSWGRKAIKSR